MYVVAGQFPSQSNFLDYILHHSGFLFSDLSDVLQKKLGLKFAIFQNKTSDAPLENSGFPLQKVKDVKSKTYSTP